MIDRGCLWIKTEKVSVRQKLLYRMTYQNRDLLSLRDTMIYDRLIQLVGTIGFEPTTPCPPDKCATKLRYAPTLIFINYLFL